MPKVTIFDVSGKDVGEMELSDSIFGIEPNEDVLHDAVIHYLAAQRQGTQSTKTRSEVRGGGRKPWRQKGTGQARHGSIRSPIWTGGGIALGPKPRSYAKKMPKKVRRLAMKSAFSARVADESFVIVDNIELDEIKTKKMIEMLQALEAGKSAIIILDQPNETVVKSARNIPNVKTTPVNALNVYDLLRYDTVIIDKGAVEKLEEVYA